MCEGKESSLFVNNPNLQVIQLTLLFDLFSSIRAPIFLLFSLLDCPMYVYSTQYETICPRIYTRACLNTFIFSNEYQIIGRWEVDVWMRVHARDISMMDDGLDGALEKDFKIKGKMKK
jgi:hypothetical protein